MLWFQVRTHLRRQEWIEKRFTNACRRHGLPIQPSETVGRVVASEPHPLIVPTFVDSHGATV